MRITEPRTGAVVGLTTVMDEASVLELDAGYEPLPSVYPDEPTFGPTHSALHDIHAQMVIIIPCKDEDPATLLRVLQGIPHPCTILLVSASSEQQYEVETTLLAKFCRPGRRRGVAIHQQDPNAANAFAGAGMFSGGFFDYRGRISAGKGEGMILGMAVALALFPEMRYVGFLDADCKISGAANEYCLAFATAFAQHDFESFRGDRDEDVMVRIHWGSKPKPHKDGSGGLDFSVAEGRSSRIVNEWLNRFIQAASGGGKNNTVTTGNAGEHAMTMSLVKKLQFAGGYAIEPFHFVDMFVRQMRAAAEAEKEASRDAVPWWMEEDSDMDDTDTPHQSVPMTRNSSSGSSSSVSGRGSPTNSPATSIRSMATSDSSAGNVPLEESPVKVYQIKTINAHIHRETDEAHVRHMWKMGLGTLYHRLLPEYMSSPHVRPAVRENMAKLRTDMEAFVEKNRVVGERTYWGQLLPEPRVYPALETLDMEVLRKMLKECPSLLKVGF